MSVKFTETVLRDANQSLMATRMRMQDFEEILSSMDEIGYYSIECWGGATFDACLRYLDEDPWERLKKIRKLLPKTKLQMLLRGQSLLGYKHYSDDIVRKFVYNCVEKGIDIVRIFDAMNDVRNIEIAVQETLRCKAHPSCAIAYTVSPVHSIENYIQIAKRYESIGAQSICIKDMSGILTPGPAYELITQLKANIKVPIILHSHCSTGAAPLTYLKAVEAGVDVIDTAISWFSGGTSQPATELFVNILKEYGYDLGINDGKLNETSNFFKKLQERYVQEEKIDLAVMTTNPSTFENQIPGGMYSNLIHQLKEQQLIDRLGEVVEEVPRVRKDLGYPPLVTPISQMVGTQAVMNVISKSRYDVILSEMTSYFRGEYGHPPGKVNKKLMKKIVKREMFPEERLSQNFPYTYEKQKKEMSERQYGRSDILTSIIFPELAEPFIDKRNHGDITEEKSSQKKQVSYEQIIWESDLEDEEDYEVLDLDISSFAKQKENVIITSPMPGKVINIPVKEGTLVRKGDVILTFESMKMENDVIAHADGTIKEICVNCGDTISMNQTLAILE